MRDEFYCKDFVIRLQKKEGLFWKTKKQFNYDLDEKYSSYDSSRTEKFYKALQSDGITTAMDWLTDDMWDKYCKKNSIVNTRNKEDRETKESISEYRW